MVAEQKAPDSLVNVERLASRFLAIFPKLDLAAQRVALETYRALAEGKAAPVERIAAAAGVTPRIARELLANWPGVFWEDGKVIGFWGLSPRPVSRHLLRIDDRTLYAWCAWDTLFLPELIGKPAEVESAHAKTGKVITMTVSREKVSDMKPAGAVMSMLEPRADMMGDIVASLCHFIFFFPSEAEGRRWADGHPGTWLMTVDEGFRLGALKNRGQFPDVL